MRGLRPLRKVEVLLDFFAPMKRFPDEGIETRFTRSGILRASAPMKRFPDEGIETPRLLIRCCYRNCPR